MSLFRWFLGLTRHLLRSLDPILLGALVCLMGVGLVTQYGAGDGTMRPVVAQGARYVIGFAVMWLLSRAQPAQLRNASPYVYLFSLLPLMLVLLIGQGRHGNLWINLGVFYFQPSELLKITLPMAVAWYVNEQSLPPRLRTILTSGVIIGIPVLLILKQPDFGTAMLVGISGAFVLYLAGLSWWWFVGAVGAVASIAPLAWFFLLRPYQKDRVLTFLNPENDPQGAGWNIIQSKIAIGSGGFFGKGLGQGTQSHLNYIPEHTTDFAFSVFSEEWGWIGVVVVFALYAVVVLRCLWIAMQSKDGWGRLVAGALGLAFGVYVIVNGGMISNLLPVVGVPMPLLSYGGTSAVSLLTGMGLVMAVRSGAKR